MKSSLYLLLMLLIASCMIPSPTAPPALRDAFGMTAYEFYSNIDSYTSKEKSRQIIATQDTTTTIVLEKSADINAAIKIKWDPNILAQFQSDITFTVFQGKVGQSRPEQKGEVIVPAIFLSEHLSDTTTLVKIQNAKPIIPNPNSLKANTSPKEIEVIPVELSLEPNDFIIIQAKRTIIHNKVETLVETPIPTSGFETFTVNDTLPTGDDLVEKFFKNIFVTFEYVSHSETKRGFLTDEANKINPKKRSFLEVNPSLKYDSNVIDNAPNMSNGTWNGYIKFDVGNSPIVWGKDFDSLTIRVFATDTSNTNITQAGTITIIENGGTFYLNSRFDKDQVYLNDYLKQGKMVIILEGIYKPTGQIISHRFNNELLSTK